MNSTVKLLNQRFYVKELLLLFSTLFFMEGIFSWILVRNSILIEGYQKLMGLLLFGYMLYNYNRLRKNERIVMILFVIMLIKLVFESLDKYDSFFRQLTMFTILFPVVFVIYVKSIMRSLDIDLLEFVAKFYMITYIGFMILFGRGFSFSLESVDMDDYGPFSGDTRVIHASHILMMIIPLLWYLHQLINTQKSKFVWPVLLCAVIIIVHQHRSVWSSCLVAMVFYFFITIRNKAVKLSGIQNLVLGAMMIGLLGYFFVSNLYPGFFDFLADRFSEILDPSREGSTGNFRNEQREVYGALFLERPFFGWTFEGFEMPNPLVDWWPENSGQHFHEGYMEMLFYEGIAGFLLKYSFVFYLLLKSFSRRLSANSAILIAFGISGLVFSFNYVLPLIYWGMIGLGLYYIEKDQTT